MHDRRKTLYSNGERHFFQPFFAFLQLQPGNQQKRLRALNKDAGVKSGKQRIWSSFLSPPPWGTSLRLGLVTLTFDARINKMKTSSLSFPRTSVVPAPLCHSLAPLSFPRTFVIPAPLCHSRAPLSFPRKRESREPKTGETSLLQALHPRRLSIGGFAGKGKKKSSKKKALQFANCVVK